MPHLYRLTFYFAQCQNMPVYYSAVSRKKIIVCDYHTVNIPLERYALQALELLGPSDERRRQEIDGRLIFTLVVKELTYLCITDMDYSQVDAYTFLERVHSALKRSSSLYSEACTCTYYALRGSEFENTLAKLTVDACGDNVFQMKGKVETVHSMIKKNVNKVAERGEALASLEERSEYLKLNSTEFQKTATKLKRKMLWKSVKLWVVLIVILLIILAVIATLITLGATHKL